MRYQRRTAVRPHTEPRVSLRAFLRSQEPLIDAGTEAELADRPVTRGDCKDGPRPCPYAGCRHHLALEVTENGGIKTVFPDREITEIPETCSLDVADRGGMTTHEIAKLINVSRTRVDQLEMMAVKAARLAARRNGIL